MIDPNILSIFSIVFILLGLYNINSGMKRLREAQRRGQAIRWYKQINLLTGIEYILLSLVFLLSLSIKNNVLPAAFKSIVVPFYLLVLLTSAVLAGFVMLQAFRNVRLRQSATTQSSSTIIASNETAADVSLTTEQQAISTQRRRERRQKAAAARRRRTGRA
ncbi:MAG TPA: hypothetical protein VNG51_05600 [Ktedonobacteraceae bacterium]|nr:hypothetical protein [Ktedonobacteraceae bacterium]